MQKVRLNVQGAQSYRVFSLNGAFVGTVNAMDVREAQAKVKSMVSERGVYLLKAKNGMSHRFMVTK